MLNPVARRDLAAELLATVDAWGGGLLKRLPRVISSLNSSERRQYLVDRLPAQASVDFNEPVSRARMLGRDAAPFPLTSDSLFAQ